ncbi:hypothetical protein NW767_009934 [Fusarium falciforme]|nr:hypothetical protein NW767_009934 [Fusarium falciforme]
MDRSRRTTHRRRPLGASASPTSASEASFDFNSSTSPVVAHTNTTPQSASAGARRSSKPLQHAFTFSPPSSSRGLNPRKRSTTMDNYPMADEDDHGPRKGGHSLRKRARVDYTFEHIDDDVIVPNSTSSARGRKRRSEVTYETDDFYGADSKRRGASMGADTPSTRRRNPSRKSSEMKAYHEAALEDDDNDVQDTIEVGAYYSDADESEFREPSGSNHSSPQANKMSPKTDLPALPAGDVPSSNPKTEHAIPAPPVEQKPSGVPPAVKPMDEILPQSAEPQPDQLPKVEPEPEASDAPQTSAPVDPVGTAAVDTVNAAPVDNPPIDAALSLPLTVPANQDRQISPAHSPAPEEAANGVLEAPVNEIVPDPIVPQDIPTSLSSHNTDTNPTSSSNIIKEETSHQPLHQVPQSPDQKPPTPMPQEDKMDIDPAEKPSSPPPQDVEMAESAPLVQEPTLAASPAPIEEAPETVAEPVKTDTDIATPAPVQVNGDSTDAEPKAEPPKEELPTELPKELPGGLPEELPEEPPKEEPQVEEPQIEEPQKDEPADLAATATATATTNDTPISDSPQIPPAKDEPVTAPSPAEIKAPTPPPPAESVETPASSAPSETKSSPQKPVATRPAMVFKPQPAPVGRWAHLTPYIDGEYVLYPERKGRSEDDGATDEPTPEGKDTDREGIDMEPMVEDNDDNADAAAPEAPTPALNTPTRGSPVPDSTDPTAFNSPAPGGDDGDDVDVGDSQEPNERRYYKYRKLRDPAEYLSAIEDHENMTTEELFEVLTAINVSMVQWQQEWTSLGKVVDDYENSLRRRAADAKYEARTRNLHQHGVNYEEPDFAVKGYKARDKESMNETRYLQGQDRIMAASYGFEYDPHPSKIGKQNPETQQVGIMTRGRSLRNQPRQTAKATETEEVTGKRQRKPVQLFDPATQDISRSSTPVPTRGGRRRKNANGDEETQTNLSVSFTNEVPSDAEAAPKTRRKRGPRGKGAVPNIVEDLAPTPDTEETTPQQSPAKPTRRGRGKPAVKYEEADPNEFVDEEPQEEKPPVRRHLLTLKIPKGGSKHFSEPASAMTDNGESRPTTASSEESSHTAESSYSFRPKRQKRFRDDPDETEESSQAPPKKRGKRASAAAITSEVPSAAPTPLPPAESAQTPNSRKVQKIKVVRSGLEAKNGAPAPTPAPAEEGEEPQKDYKSMTKSEKMSASMKNRWANGNMAGAVEKRKATLAAKKAAQAAAEQRLGVVAPKPKGKAAAKREAAMKLQMQHQMQEQQQQAQQQMMQPQPQPQPQMHPHQHQHPHGHPQHPLHLQQQPQLHQPHPQHAPPPPPPPPHQAGNPPYMHGHAHSHSHSHGHSMPGMGYPYQQM